MNGGFEFVAFALVVFLYVSRWIIIAVHVGQTESPAARMRPTASDILVGVADELALCAIISVGFAVGWWTLEDVGFLGSPHAVPTAIAYAVVAWAAADWLQPRVWRLYGYRRSPEEVLGEHRGRTPRGFALLLVQRARAPIQECIPISVSCGFVAHSVAVFTQSQALTVLTALACYMGLCAANGLHALVAEVVPFFCALGLAFSEGGLLAALLFRLMYALPRQWLTPGSWSYVCISYERE